MVEERLEKVGSGRSVGGGIEPWWRTVGVRPSAKSRCRRSSHKVAKMFQQSSEKSPKASHHKNRAHKEVPKKFKNSSKKVPKKFKKCSEAVLRRASSQNVQKKFKNGSRKVPKRFSKIPDVLPPAKTLKVHICSAGFGVTASVRICCPALRSQPRPLQDCHWRPDVVSSLLFPGWCGTFGRPGYGSGENKTMGSLQRIAQKQ